MTGGAECFVAGGTECFATGVAECFVPGGTECFVPGGTECFVGTSLVALSVIVPIFLMFFFILANGAMQFPWTFLSNLLGITITWGITATWGGASVFTLDADVGVGEGGIGQSFLLLNRFSEADHVLGQVITCLTRALGISSSDAGLDPLFLGLVIGHGTSANFPVANLYAIPVWTLQWILLLVFECWQRQQWRQVWLRLGWKV